MNFTITRQNLHNGLAAVSASIPSKTTLPVLSNILFEAKVLTCGDRDAPRACGRTGGLSGRAEVSFPHSTQGRCVRPQGVGMAEWDGKRPRSPYRQSSRRRSALLVSAAPLATFRSRASV